MLLILPPSETKRDGGVPGSSLELDALAFLQLQREREIAIESLKRLSRSVADSTAALGLGPTQRFEIERNRSLLESPTMPAIERYTGVVYDALDAATLSDGARAFASRHVAIGSALFGLLMAEDAIPAYRLSHDSRLGRLRLRGHWSTAVSSTLARFDGLILDLRSEAYSALGPAPIRANSLHVRVLTDTADGRRVALSHFNKKAKGEFARAVVTAGIDHTNADELITWAASCDIQLEPGVPGELNLVV